MRLKKLLASVLLVILTLAHAACSDSVAPKDKHYKQALEYIKIDDDESAIIELRNAIQIDAKFADARYQLGLLYLKQGNPQAAFGELQRSFGLDGKKLDAGVKVAEFYLLSRDREQTRKLIDQVLDVDPEYPDALALLANLELIEGNYQEAKTAVDKALSKNAKNDKLYNIKGRVLTALGQEDQAEKDFRKAIELNPEVFTNYRTLLMFYEQEKNEAAVQQLLAEMTSKFLEDPKLHVLLAGIHLKKGEKDDAEQEMIKAADTRKDVVSYQLMLADFYKKHNQFDKAENVLREAQKEFANEDQVKTALAELLFEKSFFPEAEELINGVLSSNPTNGAANLIKARFMIRDGRNQEALELLTPLMTDYPKWADPFYYGSLTYLRLGAPELAQKSIELALPSAPGNDRFHALAAQIHLMRGNSQDATREASIALRNNPRNGIAIKILAKSLVQAKQFEKAVELVENLPPEAVNSDPELLESLSMGYLGLNDKENAT